MFISPPAPITILDTIAVGKQNLRISVDNLPALTEIGSNSFKFKELRWVRIVPLEFRKWNSTGVERYRPQRRPPSAPDSQRRGREDKLGDGGRYERFEIQRLDDMHAALDGAVRAVMPWDL